MCVLSMSSMCMIILRVWIKLQNPENVFSWVQMKVFRNLLTPRKTASGKIVLAVFHHSCIAPIPMIYSHRVRRFNALNHSERHTCIFIHKLLFIIVGAVVEACISLAFLQGQNFYYVQIGYRVQHWPKFYLHNLVQAFIYYLLHAEKRGISDSVQCRLPK